MISSASSMLQPPKPPHCKCHQVRWKPRCRCPASQSSRGSLRQRRTTASWSAHCAFRCWLRCLPLQTAVFFLGAVQDHRWQHPLLKVELPVLSVTVKCSRGRTYFIFVYSSKFVSAFSYFLKLWKDGIPCYGNVCFCSTEIKYTYFQIRSPWLVKFLMHSLYEWEVPGSSPRSHTHLRCWHGEEN